MRICESANLRDARLGLLGRDEAPLFRIVRVCVDGSTDLFFFFVFNWCNLLRPATPALIPNTKYQIPNSIHTYLMLMERLRSGGSIPDPLMQPGRFARISVPAPTPAPTERG